AVTQTLLGGQGLAVDPGSVATAQVADQHETRDEFQLGVPTTHLGAVCPEMAGLVPADGEDLLGDGDHLPLVLAPRDDQLHGESSHKGAEMMTRPGRLGIGSETSTAKEPVHAIASKLRSLVYCTRDPAGWKGRAFGKSCHDERKNSR